MFVWVLIDLLCVRSQLHQILHGKLVINNNILAPYLQTLSDTTPEVARLFSLDIVSASLASIDVNSTHIDLIVAASDDPHGVIQFSVGALSVVEGEASVPVTVVRGDGLVGDVRVNFDLQLGSADQNDFNISSQCE